MDKVIAGNRSQDIAQAQANLNKVQVTYRQAEEDLRRNQKLQAAGAISQQALSTDRSTRDSAIAQVEQAQQALNLLQVGSRPEDIAQARAKVMAAQGAVAIVQRSIEDTVIRAPFAGIVARKYADPGAFVTQVATQSLVQQNVTSFEVKVTVSDTERLLHQGMNVTIDFKAGELTQVLVVPTAAIVQQTAVQGVFVAKTGADPVFMPIVVGTTVNDKTEVKSGLTGNERVLLSFPPGTRKASDLKGG